ncbi:UNVERIFIED_CONTAM: hypothetical protein NCL1_43118 [Trichonephila clavipes]
MTPNISTQKAVENVTMDKTQMVMNESILAIFDKQAGLVEDIIIPCVLVAVLVLGNIIIIVIIFIIRRKHKHEIDEEFEDLGEPKPQATALEEVTNE